jgi:ectoine hydroxylase-related dioxygenase (phytanoyl-CoA dioxygenase family)
MDAADIRSVTHEEVSHLRDHGWVKLDQLISPQLAARLLERATTFAGPGGDDHVLRPDIDVDTSWWSDYHDVAEEDEGFAALALSPTMGANVQRLIRRHVGILMWSNFLAVKIGTKQTSAHPSQPAYWHQDGPDLPLDRPGWVRFWIALDRVSAPMGPIRFLDGSHRLGLMGRTYLQRAECTPEAALYDEYPEVSQLPVIDSLEFEPGDATAHGMFTLYGDRGNDTDQPRWMLVLSYFADDTFYTGNQLCRGETVAKLNQAGLAPGGQFGAPVFPRVCGSVAAMNPGRSVRAPAGPQSGVERLPG